VTASFAPPGARLSDNFTIVPPSRQSPSGYLTPALKSGLLERTIPDKPQSSKQQYRLTANGEAW
jgi:hypothetical protein